MCSHSGSSEGHGHATHFIISDLPDWVDRKQGSILFAFSDPATIGMRAWAQLLYHVQIFATLWTIAHQVPLSMVFSRQEYWSGLPFPIPECLPNPGIQPVSPLSPSLAGTFFTTVPHCEHTKLPFSLLFSVSEIQSLPMQIKALAYAGQKKKKLFGKVVKNKRQTLSYQIVRFKKYH